MEDPKDRAGAPKSPDAQAIPRLTPAVPEPMGPSQAPPRPPTVPDAKPLAGAPPPSVPKVAPLVRSPPALAPPAAGGKGVPAARQTGAFPAVPSVPPVKAPPPLLTAAPVAGAPALPSIPAVPPVAARTARTPLPQVAPLLPKAAALPAVPTVAAGPASAAEERAELELKFRTLEQLDYFQVMGLEATAAPADIKRGFHHLSRTYHPDRFFQSTDAELRGWVHAVYKRVTEAYFVLRDDARRKKYLLDISGPDRLAKLRFDELSEAEAKAAVKKEVAEQIGTHPKGRQFFQAGAADLEAGRLAAAERNIKLALTYEPENPLYLQKLEETRAKSYEEFKRSGQGFRIK